MSQPLSSESPRAGASAGRTGGSAGHQPAGGVAAAKGAAVALWGIVGAALVYGVSQTVIKASALFS